MSFFIDDVLYGSSGLKSVVVSHVYKDEAQTRAYHYPRTGVPLPPDAPDRGEHWQVEYPSGIEVAMS